MRVSDVVFKKDDFKGKNYKNLTEKIKLAFHYADIFYVSYINFYILSMSYTI